MKLVQHVLALVLDDLTRNPPVGFHRLFLLEPRRVTHLLLASPWSCPQLLVPWILLVQLVLVVVAVPDPVDPPLPVVPQPVTRRVLETRHDSS